MAQPIEFEINGRSRRVEADPERTLLSLLRDDLDLTGSKYGCGEGQCGACTVLLDGRPVRTCVVQAGTAAGKKITTIEGIAPGQKLHPLQQGFLEAGALQCGYCTPGMIVAGAALLDKNPDPTDDEILRALQGHICRCGAYPRILAAFRRAATILKEERR
jgi:aerobic-type carbon monoxide dehydrogenase small subunit (CoxS/CutS family)